MRKILHITEALGGGVLHSIALLANEQVRAGCHVTLMHSIREDTPSDAELATLLDSKIRRVILHMRSEIGLSDIRSLFSIIGVLLRGRYDAIHCHSSKAGALVRIAAFLTFQIGKTCYSPHGFAFLRQDISENKRNFFLAIEKALHGLGGKIVACSVTEKNFSENHLGCRRTYLLENAIDVGSIGQKNCDIGSDVLKVGIVGRVTYAKAPWRFAEIARCVSSDKIKFVWIGDGDAESKRQWIGDSPVQITGWLDKRTLMSKLADIDIFLFTSLWEGMPIALIEAQAMGIPAVATNIIGNKDIVIHSQTGFLADSEEEILFYIKKLIQDTDLRLLMGANARRNALQRFSKERLAESSLSIYFGNGLSQRHVELEVEE